MTNILVLTSRGFLWTNYPNMTFFFTVFMTFFTHSLKFIESSRWSKGLVYIAINKGKIELQLFFNLFSRAYFFLGEVK